MSRTLRNDYRHFRNWLKSRCLTVRYGLPILGILLLVDLLMKGWEIVSLIGRGLSLSFNFLSNNLAASVTAIGVLAAFVAVYFCAKLFYKLQASRQRLAQLEALVARTHASNEDE